MPFAAKMYDDENDPNKNPNGGVNISGQSTTVSTGVPGQEGAVPGGKAKSSGQNANIQSYLDANKQQGDAMGGKIADDVTNKAEDATSKIQSYESKAPTVQAYDPNEAIGRATSLNDQEKAQYKTQKATGGYTGPATADGVQGYQDANKAGTEAAAAVKNAGTEQGQRDLLKQTYARPQYSAGENNLDQALVQGSAGSRARMEQLGQKYSGIDTALGNANAKVGDAVKGAVTQSFNNRQAFNPAETAAKKALIDPMQARADQANANNGAYIDRIAADAGDETLSDETLAALGLSEGQGLYDLNLNNYINQDRSQVGLNNVASADERGKYSALQSLFDDPTMNQITADGKEIKPVGFNKEKFDKDLSGKDTEFKKAFSEQRGTVAGQSPLGMNFDEHVPEQFRGMSVQNATPKEIEEFWIPVFKQDGAQYGYGDLLANALEKSLSNWKNTYQSSRKIKKG